LDKPPRPRNIAKCTRWWTPRGFSRPAKPALTDTSTCQPSFPACTGDATEESYLLGWATPVRQENAREQLALQPLRLSDSGVYEQVSFSEPLKVDLCETYSLSVRLDRLFR
jgi:hypothetical protein